MRIGEERTGKEIKFGIAESNSWISQFGEEEVSLFMKFAKETMIAEYANPDVSPKVIDYKFISGTQHFCMELQVMTEYGCFRFLGAPYKIYGDIFLKPTDSSRKYHYCEL